jgi:phage terminase small subunit
MSGIGSRAEVFHGNAHHTSGGLTKGDLMQKEGRIISKAQSAAAKANPALKAWRAAVKKAGGLKEGQFKPLAGKVLAKARKEFAKKY